MIERVLNDIPSTTTKNKYNALIKFILVLLMAVALIKAYFVILSFAMHSAIPSFMMFLTLFAQFLMIWMAYNLSRTGLIGIIFLTGYYGFDYQKGLYHSDDAVRVLCIVILVISVLTVLCSAFLYLKCKENWRQASPTTTGS